MSKVQYEIENAIFKALKESIIIRENIGLAIDERFKFVEIFIVPFLNIETLIFSTQKDVLYE